MRVGAAILLLLSALAGAPKAFGQGHSPQQPADADTLVAYRDTLDIFERQPFQLRPFVLPNSERVYVSGARVDTSAYRIDYRHGHLWLEEDPPGGDATLVVAYRTLPFEFKEVYRRRGVAEADDSGAMVIGVEDSTEVEERAAFHPFEGVTLEHSGSLSRGITAGSNRDLAVESGLRLQLSGAVTEGVDVRAVLSDENTPIQPEGTTQRLDDFDRVFIEVDAPQGTARLGDVELDFEETQFARIERSLQGATLTGSWDGTHSSLMGEGKIQAAGAVSRGLYHSQKIEPIDGMQGPYRLEGKEGERFILVIAGSETVYLDGQEMTRGESNDYVVDYARGEVHFTTNRLVTEDRRIRVEFEYRTSASSRTLLATQSQTGFWQRGDGTSRVRLGATFIREADDRQLSDAFGITTRDSMQIAQVGDGEAVRSGSERVAFDPEAPYVQYRREVRSGAGGPADTVFVALDRTPPDSVEVYRVRFTRVGEGQGRYIRAGRSANGILYEYRGEGQGAYEPHLRLPRPQQQQIFDLHGEVEPVAGLTLFGEWAGSLNDENRLSRLDAADDRDRAYRMGLRLEPTEIDVGGVRFGELSAEVQHHFRGRHFESFVRTRPVEFDRRWNLTEEGAVPTANTVRDEAVDEAEFQLSVTPQSNIVAEIGRLGLGNAFSGHRRTATLELGEAYWPRARYRVEYITSRNRASSEDGLWLRQRGAVHKPLLDGRLEPRLEIEGERRLQTALGTDSLARSSFSFIEYRPGLAYQAGELELGAEVELRRERDVLEGDLRDAARAWTAQTNLKYDFRKNFETEAHIGYRHRHFTDYFRSDERKGRSSIVLRSKSRLRVFEEALDVESSYQALTERTPTLQEVYVKAGPQLGQYVWEDANGDGLVQVDEFVPERTPNEGEYVQRFVPSDSLASVINVQARLRVGFDPVQVWRGADQRWKRLLTKVQGETILEVREKNRTEDLADIYLLNLSRFRQPGLTQEGRLRLGQELYFFRRESSYGLDLSFSQQRGLSDRSAGTERRFANAWELEGRYRFSSAWSAEIETRMERNRLLSESFASRTYDIRSLEVTPELGYNLSRAVRLSGGFSYARKEDDLGERRAGLLKVPLEARVTRAKRLQLRLRGEVARVDLEGDAAGLSLFEMTDGRGPGTSFLWSVNGQYRISEYLRATLAYDGRAPADAPVVNTLRMQLSASF